MVPYAISYKFMEQLSVWFLKIPDITEISIKMLLSEFYTEIFVNINARYEAYSRKVEKEYNKVPIFSDRNIK